MVVGLEVERTGRLTLAFQTCSQAASPFSEQVCILKGNATYFTEGPK